MTLKCTPIQQIHSTDCEVTEKSVLTSVLAHACTMILSTAYVYPWQLNAATWCLSSFSKVPICKHIKLVVYTDVGKFIQIRLIHQKCSHMSHKKQAIKIRHSETLYRTARRFCPESVVLWSATGQCVPLQSLPCWTSW